MAIGLTHLIMIFVRYSEIGLKSTPVRVRFENRLKDNMMSMLAQDGVEAIITKNESRFYIETNNEGAAVNALSRVFGISSLSVAETCSSSMEDICDTAAKYSMGRISAGESFAVKARREGDHKYNSIDLGREAGSAIFLANEDKGIKVKLTNPDKVFFVEVRRNKAFIFDHYVRCHGGLPIGTQGKVLAEIEDDRGIVSAWFMMKRGCKVYVRGKGSDILRNYDPDLKQVDSEDPRNISGVVLGTSFADAEGLDVTRYNVPVYTPSIGMTDDEVSFQMDAIKEEISSNRM